MIMHGHLANYQIIPGVALILLTSIKSLRIDKTTDCFLLLRSK